MIEKQVHLINITTVCVFFNSRLRLLLINDSLSINLMSDSTLQKACHTLDIMAGLSRSYDLLKRFCNQSGKGHTIRLQGGGGAGSLGQDKFFFPPAWQGKFFYFQYLMGQFFFF